jgi:hypothetical protein
MAAGLGITGIIDLAEGVAQAAQGVVGKGAPDVFLQGADPGLLLSKTVRRSALADGRRFSHRALMSGKLPPGV